MPLSAL